MESFTATVSLSASASPTNHTLEYYANQSVNRALITVSASLSMLGTMMIVATFIAWKDIRCTSRRILVYISIADFLIAGSNLFGVWLPAKHSDDIECETQSFFSTCASLWSFFWTTFLAIFMYITVARKHGDTAVKLLKVFFFFGWGIPIIVTSVALQQGVLGNDNDTSSAGWCWIKSKADKKVMWMWVTGKAWEIAAYILISLFYGLLKCHIRREVHLRQKQFNTRKAMENALKAEKRLTFVPIVLILLRIWGTIRFILFITDNSNRTSVEHDVDIVLLYLQGIGDSGQGFANFVLFCLLTEKFQLYIRKVAGKYLPCFWKRPRTHVPQPESSISSTVPVQERAPNDTSPLLQSC